MKKILAYLSICIIIGILIWSYLIAIDLSYNLTEKTDKSIDKQFFYLKNNLVIIFLYVVSTCIRHRKTIFN